MAALVIGSAGTLAGESQTEDVSSEYTGRSCLDVGTVCRSTRAVQGLGAEGGASFSLHAWLHPWLELLGRQLEDLYPGIRFKLATALQSWHPSDGSALALLFAVAHGTDPASSCIGGQCE